MKTIIRIVAVTITSLLFTNVDAKGINPAAISITNEDSLRSLKVNYPQVYQNLIKEFKAVDHLKYKVEGDALYLAFDHNNNQTNAVFSRSGKQRYAISNGDLPKTVAAKIKKGYPEFVIFSKKIIQTSTETIYQVIIENKNEYRVISFLNEEMEEQQKIKKLI